MDSLPDGSIVLAVAAPIKYMSASESIHCLCFNSQSYQTSCKLGYFPPQVRLHFDKKKLQVSPGFRLLVLDWFC